MTFLEKFKIKSANFFLRIKRIFQKNKQWRKKNSKLRDHTNIDRYNNKKNKSKPHIQVAFQKELAPEASEELEPETSEELESETSEELESETSEELESKTSEELEPETSEELEPEASEEKYNSDNEPIDLLKPKRSRSPSFIKDSININEEDIYDEDINDFLDNEDVINLSSSKQKYQILGRVKNKFEVSTSSTKKIRIKSRPKIIFDLLEGSMFLKLPVISFPSFNDFYNARPVKCLIKISNLNDGIENRELVFKENDCKIENYEEQSQFIKIALFKNYECKIVLNNIQFQRYYIYNHQEGNFFIFIEKKEILELKYDLNSFFKEYESIWILLKSNYKLSIEPLASSDIMEYYNYVIYNMGFNNEAHEIKILDENNREAMIIFKEPVINYSSSQNGFIFAEDFNQEPAFSNSFYIRLECSEILKRYPRIIHLQNSILEEDLIQEDFYNSFKWSGDNDFEIKPEYLDNKIGHYQVQVEFYKDNTYTEKFIDGYIIGFFKFCPILIDDTDNIILPSKNGHQNFPLNIHTINNQQLTINCNEINLSITETNNFLKIFGCVPVDVDKLEFKVSSKNTSNKVSLKPYIPRLKWRIKNIEIYKKYTGDVILFDFNRDFKIKKNIKLDIKIYYTEPLSNLILKIGNKEHRLLKNEKKKFVYTMFLNSHYEFLVKEIRKNGLITVNLIIDNSELRVMNISGKIGEFFEHKLKIGRKFTGDHSGTIKHNQNFLRELKIHGDTNSKGNRVKSALITILSKEVRYSKKDLQEKYFKDNQFNSKMNLFLSVNNVRLNSRRTYNTFIGQLNEIPFQILVELIDYLENNN
ncbi:MAG: hypothetical protein ACTSRI_17100 [Promethearchaeota archaeon]